MALNNDLLAKVADGGIKAITGNGPITIAMSNITGASIFDARTFDAKLSADVVTDAVMSITGIDGKDTIFASKLGGTIDAGSGADIISLGLLVLTLLCSVAKLPLMPTQSQTSPLVQVKMRWTLLQKHY